MSQHHLVEVENWRDFIAEAPDFQIVVYSGQDFRIGLEDILKQGAVDIDSFDSPLGEDKDPLYWDKDQIAKRGWQYYMLIIEEPRKGIVTTDEYAAGLMYKSNPGFTGSDCFNYVLTNGLQQSTVGKIEIIVKPWYELVISAEILSNGNYTFSVDIVTPPGEPEPDLHDVDWYFAGPHDVDGRVMYGDYPSRFWGTSLRGHYNYGLGFSTFGYRYDGRVASNKSVPNDTIHAGKIDGTTGLPFVPRDELPEVIVYADIWVDGYPRSKQGELIQLRTVFSEQVGGKWDKSGVVKDPEKDSQDILNGIITPDFAKPSGDNTAHIDSLVPDVE